MFRFCLIIIIIIIRSTDNMMCLVQCTCTLVQCTPYIPISRLCHPNINIIDFRVVARIIKNIFLTQRHTRIELIKKRTRNNPPLAHWYEKQHYIIENISGKHFVLWSANADLPQTVTRWYCGLSCRAQYTMTSEFSENFYAKKQRFLSLFSQLALNVVECSMEAWWNI